MNSRRTFFDHIKSYERASKAYQRDCNTRFIPKPDKKRLRLRKASNAAFKKVMAAFLRQP